MAGGKLTPRQKMINLMYLVFIAMLALNMSKEVLSAFGILNNKLTDSNQIMDHNNSALFGDLAQKAEEQPGQYAERLEKAAEIRKISADYVAYLEGIKAKVTEGFELDEDGNLPFEQMDKGETLDHLFFKGDKITEEGQEFLSKVKTYNVDVQKIAGSFLLEETQEKMNKRFSTEDVFSKKVGKNIEWLNYHYFGYPAIASLTKLTQLQNDVKITENEVISGMFMEGIKRAASLTGFEAIVVPDKTAFFAGETVTGKVILGKKDPNLKAHKVIINGKELDASQMQAGQALFSFGAGNVGEQEFGGEFQFKEGDSIVKLPIKGNYVVVPKPNSANISADKMNVVYIGVDNPMTISFAGVTDNNVTAAAPGLTKSSAAGKYVWRPQGGSTEATVSVSGKLPDGTSVSDKKTFRIKTIPAPATSLRGIVGGSKGSKENLTNSPINVVFNDFDFEVKTTVIQFEVKAPGSSTIVCQGNRFNAAAIAAINKSPNGGNVIISNVKTRIEGTNVPIKDSTPFVWEIQ